MNTRVSASTHWLLFANTEEGTHMVTGCQCGFVASPDDCGQGDSVVDHIYESGRRDSGWDAVVRASRSNPDSEVFFS